MLQISQPSSRNSFPVVTRGRKIAKPSASYPHGQKLIDDFRLASRKARLANARFLALSKRYPDLEDPRPSVLFYTDAAGNKFHGSCLSDFNRRFPESLDHFSPGNQELRAHFVKALDKAQLPHKRRRREAGITAAYMEKYISHCARLSAFKKLCFYKPASLGEAAKIAKVIRAALPTVVGDIPIYGCRYAAEITDAHKWAIQDAFDYMATFLRTLSKLSV